MAHYLITGGAGFIGSNLSRAILERGDQVTAIDNFNDYYDPAIKERNAKSLEEYEGFTLVRGDICDGALVRRLLEENEFKSLIHLAAWAGVQPSLDQPIVYARNNVEGTTVLLEGARHCPDMTFVLTSSSSVYGGVNEVPFREDMDVDHPISVYAATKRACEIMASTYHSLYGMDIWCMRLFTCYGPGQRPDLAIHKFCKLIEAGEEIPMYGDGSTCRDYLYVDDCVQAFMAAADRCKGFDVINVGESRTVRLDELIALISKTLGKEAKVKQLPERLGDVPRTFADVTKAKELLGYQPTTMIEEGLEKFVDWFRKVNR